MGHFDDRKRGCLVGDPRAMRRRGKVKIRGGEPHPPISPGLTAEVDGSVPTRRVFPSACNWSETWT